MTEAEMLIKVTSDGDVIFERELKAENGDKDSIRPALLGFNQQIFDDTAPLLYGPPLGPLDEVIELTLEYEIKYDGERIFYYTIKIETQRFAVLAAIDGTRNPVNNKIVNFINDFFII